MSHPTPSAGRRPPARPSPTPLPAPHRSQLSPTALAQSARSCPLPHTCPRGPLHACAQQNVQPTCTFVHAMHATGLRVCTERGHAASSNGCTAVPQPHTCAGSSAHMGAVCAPWLQAVHTGPPRPPPAAWPCSTAGGAARRAGAVISRGMHSQGHSAQPAPRGWPHTSSASAAPCWCWDGVRPAAATPVAAALRREPTMLQLGAPVWLPVLARGLLPEAQPFVPRTTVPGEPLLVSSSLPAPGRVTWVGRGGGSRRSPGCRWGVGARGQRRCVTVFMRTSRSARDVRMALPAAALPGGTVPPRSPRRS